MRCYDCEGFFLSSQLTDYKGQSLCLDCLFLRGLPIRARKKEVTVTEEKPIASVNVYPTEDEDNYRVEGFVRFGGVKVEMDTDLNRMRDFFTKRRECKPQRQARP